MLAGVAVDQAVKDEVRAALSWPGFLGCWRTSPFVAGREMTLADIYLRYALAIPRLVGPAQLDWDIMAEVDGLAGWYAMMADSDIARKVDADMQANTADFMAFIASRKNSHVHSATGWTCASGAAPAGNASPFSRGRGSRRRRATLQIAAQKPSAAAINAGVSLRVSVSKAASRAESRPAHQAVGRYEPACGGGPASGAAETISLALGERNMP